MMMQYKNVVECSNSITTLFKLQESNIHTLIIRVVGVVHVVEGIGFNKKNHWMSLTNPSQASHLLLQRLHLLQNHKCLVFSTKNRMNCSKHITTLYYKKGGTKW